MAHFHSSLIPHKGNRFLHTLSNVALPMLAISRTSPTHLLSSQITGCRNMDGKQLRRFAFRRIDRDPSRTFDSNRSTKLSGQPGVNYWHGLSVHRGPGDGRPVYVRRLSQKHGIRRRCPYETRRWSGNKRVNLKWSEIDVGGQEVENEPDFRGLGRCPMRAVPVMP